MVRVRVPASVGLRALNRTPARPKGFQQDDRQDDRRQDDRPAGRRKEPDTLNTLDPAYFNPPPPVDRQQGPDTLDALGSVDQDPALDRQDGQTLDGRQGQDGLDRPAPRPTPRQRAKLFDAEQQAKQQAKDAKAKEENPGAWLFQQMRRANLHKAKAKAKAKELASALVSSRGGRQARSQADAGVRDSQPNRGLPKVVVYNGSPGPRAPRSPR